MTEVPPTALVGLLDRSQAPLPARRFYGAEPTSPITASLAQVPELLEAALPFVGVALGPAGLDARTKEVAVLRTSALLECRYCVQSHTVIALDTGLTRDEVRALRGEVPLAAAFPGERDRALLEWIDAVALGRGPLEAGVQARAAAAFSDHELVELTMAVTATLMLNRYCTALDLPVSAATLTRLAEEDLT